LHLFKGRLLLNKLVESGKSMKTKDFNWTNEQEALKEEELWFLPITFITLNLFSRNRPYRSKMETG
jgi:hypothetical protein